MATRVLPGAYVTLNDLSQFPEGQTSLVVGYVLKCNRGKVGEPFLVTSPTDFLAKTTLTGQPAINDDPTFWSILKVLARTNQVYIARAANNPLYGGAIIKKSVEVGTLTAVVKSTKTFTITGTTAPAAHTKILVKGTGIIDGTYTVATASVASGTITLTNNTASSLSNVSKVLIINDSLSALVGASTPASGGVTNKIHTAKIYKGLIDVLFQTNVDIKS